MNKYEYNSKALEQLKFDDKKNLQIYFTARQFKNSIFQDEVFILPVNKGNNFIPGKMVIKDHMTITFRGDKTITRIIPYIVNNCFACELYLKLLLSLFHIKIDDIPKKKRHNLYILYDKLPPKIKIKVFNDYLKASSTNVDIYNLENEIKNISSIFVNWRYIHETIDKQNVVNSGFLRWFCDILDIYCVFLIKEKYNYDVILDFR